MKIGLRVDVDTFKGTRSGVPSLLRTMDRYGVRAAFFFSAGPDNMGRHLWRLLKPAFMWKMLRTKAASLYGLDILLMGTMWPGPRIAKHNASVFRDTAKAGHEIGVHAWDHQYWQSHVERMSPEAVYSHILRAYEEIERVSGVAPSCSAVPGWKCVESTLLEKERFNFRYNSDCRGRGIFMPVVDGRRLTTPQIALNLPTYDELLGKDGVTNENYNERLISLIDGDGVNLLTIHAEAEGGVCSGMFEDFLKRTKAMGIEFVAPGDLIPESVDRIEDGCIKIDTIPGREGTLAVIRFLS